MKLSKSSALLSPPSLENYSKKYPAMFFFGERSKKEMLRLLDKISETCETCGQKKLYYCTEKRCKKKEVICACQTKDLKSIHYYHGFTYVLPLFSVDSPGNYTNTIQKFNLMREQIEKTIKILQKPIEQLDSLQAFITEQSKKLQDFYNESGMKQIQSKLSKFEKNQRKGLGDILNGISLITSQHTSYHEKRVKEKLDSNRFLLNSFSNPLSTFYKNIDKISERQMKSMLQHTQILKKTSTQLFQKYENQLLTDQYKNTHIALECQGRSLTYQLFKQCQGISITQTNEDLWNIFCFPNLKKLTLSTTINSPSPYSVIEFTNQLVQLKLMKTNISTIQSMIPLIKRQNNLERLQINIEDRCFQQDLIKAIEDLLKCLGLQLKELLILYLPDTYFTNQNYRHRTINNENKKFDIELFNSFFSCRDMVKIKFSCVLGTPVVSKNNIHLFQKMKDLQEIHFNDVGEARDDFDKLKKKCLLKKRIRFMLSKHEKERIISKRTMKNIICNMIE